MVSCFHLLYHFDLHRFSFIYRSLLPLFVCLGRRGVALLAAASTVSGRRGGVAPGYRVCISSTTGPARLWEGVEGRTATPSSPARYKTN